LNKHSTKGKISIEFPLFSSLRRGHSLKVFKQVPNIKVNQKQKWSQTTDCTGHCYLRFFCFAVPLLISGQIALIYRIILCTIFIASAAVSQRNKNLVKYSLVFFAFFISSLVSLFEYLLYSNQSLLYWISASRMDLYVLFKVLSALLVVIPIVLLTKVSRQDMPSIYLTKGKLRLGLIVGTALFLFFLATSIGRLLYFTEEKI
jgi:hypothetical protein